MKNNDLDPRKNNKNHATLYQKVLNHCQDELINSNVSDEWLSHQAKSSHAIVRKLIIELKQRSEVCHELLRDRLVDLNLSLEQEEDITKSSFGIQSFGSIKQLRELYTSNAILTGKSEELLVELRRVQDGRTASLLARMRNIQLERHKFYTEFFQTDRDTYKSSKTNFETNFGEN